MRREHIKLSRRQALKSIMRNMENDAKRVVVIVELEIVLTEVFI